MTMLDVGCGWGSLSLHAAEHFGAQVIGVTIAAEQKRFIDARIAERGLGDHVAIRAAATTARSTGSYDAVGSLEMGEHVGERNYPTYVDGSAARGRARWPGAGAADVAAGPQRRQYPGGGPFIESLHRAGHAHAAGRRDRGATSRPGAGGPRRARPARALRAHRGRLAGELRGQPRPPDRSRRRGGRSGSGGSTSSAGRWPSATAGWASTRSSGPTGGPAPVPAGALRW